MMQISEPSNQKHSLFNAMNRFIGAVNNMDQTVMVPSLLRDVPLDDEREMTAIKSTSSNDMDDGDMYSYYQLLKSIRQDIELGVRRAEERRMESVSMKVSRSDSEDSSEDSEEEDDLEKQFQFHMTGLHGVLSKLTQQAHTLTNRYKQEIGIGGWGQ